VPSSRFPSQEMIITTGELHSPGRHQLVARPGGPRSAGATDLILLTLLTDENHIPQLGNVTKHTATSGAKRTAPQPS